jgi:hypothetical protein
MTSEKLLRLTIQAKAGLQFNSGAAKAGWLLAPASSAGTNHRNPMNCNREKNGCHVLFQHADQPP